ncbi:hypothetical protein DOTSEDRAFT_72688 [Dothistroma septosporum NZE10]|uniref:Histidine kinase n=1 Tax=Dothistroma septosporum (strain NZE10 / CBS 128990) TaxID=675120 RepID=M2YN32_DOTSN|nr:hypothetical protein DOTSEDRAFT_72688 [Dothistroma septosporum NZE10]
MSSRSWLDHIPRTPHNELFLAADYASTPLGPHALWGPALRLYASMVFADSRGAGVYWGPQRIAFYNETFAVVCQGAHPFLMGHAFDDAFPELAASMQPLFDRAYSTGQTMDVDNMPLFVNRNGFLEETYFIGQFIPIRGDGGEVEGLYNTVVESTAERLSERRRRVIDLIAAIPPLTVEETLQAFTQALRTNPYDITAAALYSYIEGAEENQPSLRLRGSIGIPQDHGSFPKQARLESSQDALMPFLREAKKSGKPVVLSTRENGPFGIKDHVGGIEWCGFPEGSISVVVSPLIVGNNVLGFYIQGTNPRRPFDDATRMSIADLVLNMETKWISSVSKQDLEQRQRILEERAGDSERQLRHLAQSAPVGMVKVGIDATIQWANDQFYDITGHDRSKPDLSAFRLILAEDQRDVSSRWLEQLIAGDAPRRVQEHRLARSWQPPVVEEEGTELVSAWILVECFPVVEAGQVKHLLGYITDISHQKWAENIQSANATAAKLAKKRQEEFIDVVCHEARNPLSAIIQLADGIATSVSTEGRNSGVSWRDLVVENANAASIILACAGHQKRVIDDVLMLSRLDSNMLPIRPVIDQPSEIIASAVRMLEGETKMNGSKMTVMEANYTDGPPPNYVLVDSSRLIQILINFLSNSLKFSAKEAVKGITITHGAQKTRPLGVKTKYGSLCWVPSEHTESTNKALGEANQGEDQLYLTFLVEDTGVGIPPDQLTRLFKRFSQTSSRSHVSYGGSGLGLYICRELIEKQGGRVGVASRHGEGTAFAFYIESRIAAKPCQSIGGMTTWALESDVPMNHEASTLPDPLPEETDERLRRTPIRRKSAVSLERPGSHILLAEDNLINQRVLAKQLRAKGCTVTVANHGEEALQILEKSERWSKGNNAVRLDAARAPTVRVDIILMDIEMPVMDGLQCAARIRQLERDGSLESSTPILALTANAREEQKHSALVAGMDDVLSKPVTVAEVLDKIQVVMSRICNMPN